VNLENTLYYFTHHSETIIQWLFLAILLISAYVIARALFGRKSEATASVTQAMFADGSDVQTFLKKILDQTTKLEGLKLEGLSTSAVGEVDAQVQALKKDLAQREEELTKLKTGGGAGGSEVAARIKELEAKLSEYEILEDDIADLSLYKEENVRLRSELDKLKNAVPDSVSAPAPSGEDIVKEFADAVNQEVTPSAPVVPLNVASTGDPLADFESAVKLEKQVIEAVAAVAPASMTTPIPEPPNVNPLSAVQAAVPPNSTSAESKELPVAEGDDLFAEFAAPPADEEGSLDTDKMMAEMAELVSLKPADGSSLNEDIDTEKMAAEATRLHKA
jgi:hypothetical protein